MSEEKAFEIVVETGKGEVSILNATPHDIHIFKPDQVVYDESVRKYLLKLPDEKPVRVIPRSGVLLNVKADYELKEIIDDIPIYVLKVKEIDPVPRGYDIVIVSAMYATYAKKARIRGLDRLYTVSQPVYESRENLKPVGVLGLNKVVE